MTQRILFLLTFLGLQNLVWGQKRFFAELEIRVDTTIYSSLETGIMVNGKSVLAFPVFRSDQIVDLYFNPPETGPLPRVYLSGSKEYVLIDTLRLEDSAYFRARIQFTDITKGGIIPITLRYVEKSGQVVKSQLFELYPFIATRAQVQQKDDELFLGEEKVLDIATSNITNIKADGTWQTLNGVGYRFFVVGTQLKLSLVTNDPGQKEIKVPLQTYRYTIANGRLTNELTPLSIKFVAKASRIAFLSFDKKEVTLDFESPKGIEVQIDRSRLMQIKKTYRIETTAEPGGAFVGELYTRSSLSNDKVLAWLRPYALHRNSDGYLYLKDGDDLKFITNINITEKTRIQKVLVRHPGGEFGDNLSVSPGEQVDVRIEGTGLEKVAFQFEGATNVLADSALATENVSVYSLRVPISIQGRKMVLYRGKEPTGYELVVKEFQRPRPLDFIYINWGNGEKEVGLQTKPILYDKNIPELTLTSQPQKIDAGGKLFGKQYLIADINIFNVKKDLIETRRIENIVIIPGEESPRFGFYDAADGVKGAMNLNQFLAHKTFDLPDWATIEITIKHNPFKYGGELGYSQKIEIILQKHITFDIDVSFPAGLQIFTVDDNSYNSLNGISLAVLPQLSFYKPEKIAKLRPYRVGIGFIALNAFDFADNAANRDIGAVVLGSLFPTRTGSRFSFPLYGGFGYKLRAGQFFFLFGPGIQVRL
jgi:hypothetical protein